MTTVLKLVLARVCTMFLVVASTLMLGCDSGSPTEPCSGPFLVGNQVTAPVAISQPAPQYTEEARQARIQGVVVVQALIDCNGTVNEITVLQGLSHGLTEAATEAIAGWSFAPARRDGKAVSVLYNLTVNFRISES